MNKMKKLLVLVSLALVLGFVIGCQDTVTPEPTPVPTPTPTPSTVATPVFTPADGSTVVEGAEITLASATEGASVYYTIGTSEYSAGDWTLYDPNVKPKVAFGEKTSITYKAIAVKTGFVNSDVVTATYTPPHVAVTGIKMEIATAIVGTEKSLIATVEPSTATNKNIVWTTTTANASITEGKLTSTKAQEVEVTATIKDGTAIGTDYIKTFTITVTLLPMVSIPQGEYEYQGTDGGDPSLKENKNVVAFYLGETEVTQGQWEAVMGETWPEKDPETDGQNFGDGDNYPAYYISWYDAIEFCNALTRKELTEDDVVYTITKTNETDQSTWIVVKDATKKGYRLPTEVEWEYAAGHGGFKADGAPNERFTFAGTNNGETTGDNSLTNFAVYGGNNVTPAVTSNATVKEGRTANDLGLYDMSGNVWEWCYDLSGTSRVLRGGSWINNADFCRVAHRAYSAPSDWHYCFGFRVARSL